MQEEQTCGKGLAENSVLPAYLGVLTAAMAEVLEVHRKALDLTDPNAKAEDDAYAKLVHKHREIAAKLQAAADRMAGYRDLPMGRHDEQATTTVEFLDVFENFVKAKQELLILLQKQVELNQTMLVQMRGVIDAGR
jgi:hypothetical protein